MMGQVFRDREVRVPLVCWQTRQFAGKSCVLPPNREQRRGTRTSGVVVGRHIPDDPQESVLCPRNSPEFVSPEF